MKEFLEQNRYKMWKQDEEFGSTTQYFQKRIDRIHKYIDTPLCQCNDKVLIDIEYYDINMHGFETKSCVISVVGENKNDDWCDLKIYSIPVEKMKENLVAYEDKIVKLWKAFSK